MERKNRKSKKNNPVIKRNRKQRLVLIGFILFMMFLFFETTRIYITYGEEYRQLAMRQQVYGRRHVDRTVNPNRGSIVDRNGQVLAVSHTVYNIFIDVILLAQATENEVERTLETLYDVLDIPKERIQEYISIEPQTGQPNRNTHFLVVARQVSPLNEALIRNTGLRHVHSEEDTLRTYPAGDIIGPIVGFLSGDGNHWGLERTYDTFLTGRPGREVRMFNETGIVTTNEFRPVTGYTLVTTLDLQLMTRAKDIAQEFGSRYNANTAQVVIMNPNTGEILAMAQYPSFNNNDPFNLNYITSPRLREEIYYMSDQERINTLFGLWANSAISHSFEPGSIFKPITSAIALEERVTFPGEMFFCPGYFMVLGERIPCWNEWGQGQISLEEAMAASCNVVSMILAERLGRNTFYNYLREFGVGQTTGIDVSGEASFLALTYSLHQLNPVEMATSSMGQGFNMTAIQAITAFSAIINGGNIMIPHVVSQVTDGETIVQQTTPTIRRNVISQGTSDLWRNTMVQTLESQRGTGRGAHIPGYLIGGKTGTAQQGIRELGEHVYSFVGFLPADNPQYVALVTIDRPDETWPGSSSVQAMLRAVLEEIITQRGILPYTIEQGTVISPMVVIEDYVGLSFLETVRRLSEKDLIFRPISSGGTVIGQQPLAGSTVARGTTVILYLSDEYYEGSLVMVPSLAGMTIELATETLQTIGLNYMISQINTDQEQEEGAGTVISQVPQPGLRIPLGTEILLIVGS
ncbi:MAG: penicillin-binding transpeptidase domain-containing protein [Defluviitaleaceae bacterium]|nr:penicillin-binding transpeptidase domain-containing protein [Defluviitaleaceae bacterium]